MTAPPLVPRVLLAAATPSADYDSIAGDLHEEYAQRRAREGRSRADCWYWSQALRSLPALLAYSRAHPSLRGRLSTAAIAVGVLIAMLAGKDLVDRLIDGVRPRGELPAYLYFLLDWAVAAACGAMLAQLVRGHPVRLALLASGGLVCAFATPIVLALSPNISPAAWLLLLGAIPAMCTGAATLHAFRHR